MGKRTYTVSWSRKSSPDEVLTCRELTARVAFARLIKATRTSGPIVIREVTPE